MSIIEDRITQLILQRAKYGLNKYGVTLADNKLTRKEILQHAKEEACDLAAYLEKEQATPYIELSPEFHACLEQMSSLGLETDGILAMLNAYVEGLEMQLIFEMERRISGYRAM